MSGKIKSIIGNKGDKPGQFKEPIGVTFITSITHPDSVILLVCDADNNRIQSFDIVAGKFLDQFAHKKYILWPRGIAINHHTNQILVANSNTNVITIHTNYPQRTENNNSLTQFGSFIKVIGYNDGIKFVCLRDLTTNSKGEIIVSSNHKIDILDGNNYKVIKSFGSYGEDNDQFDSPYGVCVDSQDNIFVTDYKNQRVSVFNNEGKWICPIEKERDNGFSYPCSVSVDNKNGDIYLLDYLGCWVLESPVELSKIKENKGTKRLTITPTANASPLSFGSFGLATADSSKNKTITPATSVFGAPSTATPSTTSIFGTTAASPTTTNTLAPSIFGKPTPAPATSVFGATATNNPPAMSVFGATTNAPATSVIGKPTPAPTTSVFGATTNASSTSISATFTSGSGSNNTSNPSTSAFGALPSAAFGVPSTLGSTAPSFSNPNASAFGVTATFGAPSTLGGGTTAFGGATPATSNTTEGFGFGSSKVFGGGGATGQTIGFGSVSNANPDTSAAFGGAGNASAFGSTFGSNPLNNPSFTETRK
eukprot:TRINITY_DN2285_c0_g1_i1.p1 TRINITY_DN2285_c0_g1~~TRINITY_DN2285_c0_g1_i1.p1  ORF type:complete len:538 (+),score=123.40 TRINITY_DN2285_c0_g1_i1:1470-3083(+)